MTRGTAHAQLVAGGGRLHETRVPDVETASADYAARFAGPVGRWMLETQASLVLDLVGVARPGSLAVLDVGGGHGQLAAPLVRAGHRVVVHGSRPASLRSLTGSAAPVARVSADLWRLPFADRRFDLVVGIRLLAHVEAWRELLAEMARVSRQLVLVDFPARSGLQALGPSLFGVKRRFEGNTRPYFGYAPGQIDEALRPAGFQLRAVRREFAVPMALHRLAGSRRLSGFAEDAARALGLTKRVGSPVLALAERSG